MGLLPDGASVRAASALTARSCWPCPTRRCASCAANRMAMVFQEPMSALNPCTALAARWRSRLRLHQGLSRQGRRAPRPWSCWSAWALPGRPSAWTPTRTSSRRAAPAHHHRHGAGLRARPTIADEPTTALDVTVQRQILEPLAGLVAERGMALILISHDLGVIAQSVARTLVMYGGTVVESGPTRAVLAQWLHPYTQGLFAARPGWALRVAGERLPTIAGSVPDLADLPAGCLFAGRCARAPWTLATPPCPRPWPWVGHEARCIRLGEPCEHHKINSCWRNIHARYRPK